MRANSYINILVLFISILSSSSVGAATIHIPADQPTIQDGIDASWHGDLVLVAPGTYVENINFGYKGVTVQSEAGAYETIIDGGECTQGESYCSVVTFKGMYEQAAIDGFTIRNGNGYADPSKDTLKGGGIFCLTASPTIRDCIITGNTAYDGGGAYFHYSSAVLENCTIIDNIGRAKSGGILCWESSPTIRDCTISGNSTEDDGGGMSISLSNPTITNCVITENFADGCGGGILLYISDPILEDCAISRNVSRDYGGGIKGYQSSPMITNCEITDNIGEESGGGCWFYSYCNPTISHCTISRNETYTLHLGGGGIYLDGLCDATITNCEISDNRSLDKGGGIVINSSSPIITNCIISGNIANEHGGGIHYYGCRGTQTITNCTISGNHAGSFGGGVCCKNIETLMITNSILWGDHAPEGPELALIDDSALTVSYSDVQGGDAAVYVDESTLTWLDGNIDSEPLFVGGDHLHLGSGSPCIDAADSAPSHNDVCFPPSMGTERADMGAYGGPEACGWCGDHDADGHESAACGGMDCNDRYADTYPGAEEICDGRDNDCDGQIDEDFEDADGDGSAWCADCDDSDPTIHPGAEETCDHIDNNCNGFIDEDFDRDGDGWTTCDEPMPDCDDLDPFISPGKDEDCDNGVDDDCDGLIDYDDPECVVFQLEVWGYYSAGYLNISFTLSAPEPATWATYLLLTFPTIQIIPLWIAPLWTEPLPVVYPPMEIPIAFPFPSLGWIGIYTGLFTAEGIQVFDFNLVHTG